MTTTTTTFNHGLEWEEGHGYSQGFRAGDTVYISGQLSHDDRARLVGESNIEKQLEVSLAHLEEVLAGFGATRNQIVNTTVLVVGLRQNFTAVSQAHSSYFGQHRPASTVLGVSDLALPGQLVEIAATLRLDIPR